VISSEHVNGAGKVNFERVEQDQYFDREGASVDIVSQKYIFLHFWIASHI
jgi:hypothetical protein